MERDNVFDFLYFPELSEASEAAIPFFFQLICFENMIANSCPISRQGGRI